jgi:hypothetical protein
MRDGFLGATFNFGKFFPRQVGVIPFKFVLEIIPKCFQNLLLFFRWQRTDLFNYFGDSRGRNLLR